MNLGRKEFRDDFSAALAIVPVDAPAARIPILLSAARCVPLVAVERSYAEEALALARAAGDVANEANALLTLAMFRAGIGQHADVGSDPLELIAQARAMAERTGAHELLAKAAINESHLLEGAGRHELAVEAARRGFAGQETPYIARASRSLLALNQVEPLFALGRWDEALAVAEAVRDFQFGSLPLHRSMLAVFTGRIALARGDVEAAASAAGTAAELLRGSPQDDQRQFPLGVLEIGLRLAVAGPGAALEVASQVVDGYELAGGSPRYAWPLVASAALACVVAARDERLRADVAALADRLRTIAAKLEASGSAQQASQATFVAADAQVAGVGDAGGWLAAWDEAAAAWGRISEPYSQAEALLHASEAALAGGDRDGAAGRLRLAAALAARLGAGSLAAEIALLARRARIVLDTSAAAVGPDAVGLTGRELEVLRLVAVGRSNREIANELFISPKTASVHVSNILGKLGAASRSEAASKAHALRLVDPVL